MGKYNQYNKQKGFSLLELILVSSIISVALMGAIAYSIQVSEKIRAETAGEQFADIGKALSVYLSKESSVLFSCISIGSTLNAIPLTILTTATGTTTVGACTLNNRQILPSTTNSTNLFGTGYNIAIQNNVSGVLGGLVISSNAITDPGDSSVIKYDWLGIAMRKAGSQSGMTFSVTGANSLRGLGGGWALSNTDFAGINKLGLFGYRVGFQSNYDDVYLRLDGAYPMRGNLNMGNFNVNNATDINFNGWLNGNNALLNNLKTGYISNSGNIQTNTLTATSDISSGANVRATTNVEAGNDVRAGQNVNAGYNVNAFNSVIAGNSVVAGANVQAGNMVIAYSDIVTNTNVFANIDIYATRDVSSGRDVIATRDVKVGRTIQLSGVYVEGTGCSPNGSLARNGTGAALSCDSGIWTKGGGDVPSGTQCGNATSGSRLNDGNWSACAGHNPRSSCPAGWHTAFVGEADRVYFYSCIKN